MITLEDYCACFLLIQQRKLSTLHLFLYHFPYGFLKSSQCSRTFSDCLFPAVLQNLSHNFSRRFYFAKMTQHPLSVLHPSYWLLWLWLFLTWTFHRNSLLARLRLRSCAIWKVLDDTFVSGSRSAHWILFRNTKAKQKAIFTSTATLKAVTM